MRVSFWWGVLLSGSACEGGSLGPDAGQRGDAAIIDVQADERIDEAEADVPRIIECQPGSQQTCRGDDACWGHRNCSDQYKLGDCICETAAGGAGSDASSD